MNGNSSSSEKRPFSWPGCILGFAVGALFAASVSFCVSLSVSFHIRRIVCSRLPADACYGIYSHYGLGYWIVTSIEVLVSIVPLIALWWAVYRVIAGRRK